MYRQSDSCPLGIYSMEARAFPRGSSKRSQETIITHRPPGSLWPPQDPWPQPQTIDTDPLETPNTNGVQVSLFMAEEPGKKDFAAHPNLMQEILRSNNQGEINDIAHLADDAAGLAIFS